MARKVGDKAEEGRMGREEGWALCSVQELLGSARVGWWPIMTCLEDAEAGRAIWTYMVNRERIAQRAYVLPQPGMWDVGMNCSVELPVLSSETDQLRLVISFWNEATMNPVVVLVWHSSVVAVVWHRGQRRCLGGDLTSVLTSVVFLNLSKTTDLGLNKIEVFWEKKIILLTLIWHYILSESRELCQHDTGPKLTSSVSPSAESVEGSVCCTPGYFQRSFSLWHLGASRTTPCPQQEGSSEGLSREEEQKVRDMRGVYYIKGQWENRRQLWESVCPSDWDVLNLVLCCRS